MKSLFNIKDEYRELISHIENEEGEISPELEDMLKINSEERDAKSLAYVGILSEKEAKIQMMKLWIERATNFLKAEQKIIERLKSNLLDAVVTYGPYEVGVVRFNIIKSHSLEVDPNLNINHLDDKYITTKVTTTPNKVAIKNAINAGEEIEGCWIKENNNLKIK